MAALRRGDAWSVLLFVCCLVACPPSRAQKSPSAEEDQVKAAFIYKFVSYIDWPAGALGPPDAPFTIALRGADSLAAELAEVVAGRKLKDRDVRVRRLEPGDTLDGVNLLFLGREVSLDSIQSLRSPVLVVTEAQGALDQGSMINFIVVNRRLRFEIGVDAADKAGLSLSSRLLAIAQRILAAPS